MGVLQNVWVSLIHNTTNTPSWWPSPCVLDSSCSRWSAYSKPGERAGSVQPQTGNDLPTKTRHPPSVKELHVNSPKQSLVQRGTNSDTFEKKPSWFLQHFLQHFNNISLASTFVSKCSCIWELKYHKEVISTYELFFQVKEVALESFITPLWCWR